MTKAQKYLAIVALSLSGASIFFIPYMRYYFQTPMLEAFQITNEQLGLFYSIYAFGCIFLYIPGGILADRYKPKKILIGSLVCQCALCLILAASLNYKVALGVWFMFAFTTTFVFWTSLIKAVRMIGTSEEQGKIFGLYYAGNGAVNTVIGFITVAAFSYVNEKMGAAAGIRAVILVSVAVMALAALAVTLFFKDGDSNDEEKEKFSVAAVLPLIKTPIVWLIAFTVFCAFGLVSSSTYFVPFLTDVMGVSVETSATLGVIRTSLFLLVCAPLSGFIADRLQSTSKWFLIAMTLLAAAFAGFYFMPADTSQVLAMALSLVPGALALMIYGIVFSIVGECKIPLRLTGIVVGLASIIGYSPDLFFHAMFGQWIDTYGALGYKYIFLFLTGLCILGMFLAYNIRKMTNNRPPIIQ